MPQRKERKQFNYLPALTASAPAFAAKALIGDLPKGAIEHAVEKKLVKPGSSFTSNFTHGLRGRGAGRAMGAGVGVLTAPLFLHGIRLAGSDDKSDQRKGLALIGGTGATFAFQKALLEKIQASRAAGKGISAGVGKGLRIGGFRALYKTPAALAMGLGVAAGRKRAKKSDSKVDKFLLPAAVGAAAGGLSRGSEDVVARLGRGKGGLMRRIQKALPATAGGVAGGALGGLVLSGVVDAAMRSIEKKGSVEKLGTFGPGSALLTAITEKALAKGALGYDLPGRLVRKTRWGRKLQEGTHDTYARNIALGIREGLQGQRTAGSRSTALWGASMPEMLMVPRAAGQKIGNLLQNVPPDKREAWLQNVGGYFAARPHMLTNKVTGEATPLLSHLPKAIDMAVGKRPLYGPDTGKARRWFGEKFLMKGRGETMPTVGKGLPRAINKHPSKQAIRREERRTYLPVFGLGSAAVYGGRTLQRAGEAAGIASGIPGMGMLGQLPGYGTAALASQATMGATKPWVARAPVVKQLVEKAMKASFGHGVRRAVLPKLKSTKKDRLYRALQSYGLSVAIHDPGKITGAFLSGAVADGKNLARKKAEKALFNALTKKNNKAQMRTALKSSLIAGGAGQLALTGG